MSQNVLKFSISSDLNGLRLDKALSALDEVGSRTRAQMLLENNKISLNGNSALKSSHIVKEGEVFKIELPEPQSTALVPLDLKLEILFEDDDLLVINKPAGLVVHPGAGHENDTLVNALINHTKNLSMKFGEDRPGIVHRLDKDTSGTLVVAKNDQAHEALSLQFQERKVHRIYWAVSHGSAAKPQMKFQSFIARHPSDRKKMASIKDKHGRFLTDPKVEMKTGKWAVTHAWKAHFKNNMSLFRLKLETGRTHQIRVHMSEAGLPIIGDILYGSHKMLKTILSQEVRTDIESLDRFLLHAAELGFVHPRTGEKLFFKSPWPDKETQLLKKWGFILELLEPPPEPVKAPVKNPFKEPLVDPVTDPVLDSTPDPIEDPA